MTRSLVWPLLLLCLGGCRPRPPESLPAAPVIFPEVWRLQGRLHIRSAGRAVRAHVRWRQEEDRYQLRLTGSFGSWSYEIVGDSENLELTSSQGQVLRTPQAKAMLRERLGWIPPLEALRYWVRGLPVPGQPLVDPEWGENGRLLNWTQEGCHIQVHRYERRDGWELPTRVSLRKEKLRLELRIAEWRWP